MRACACVSPEKLASEELLHQDARGARMRAEEEQRKGAARVALSHFNRALVRALTQRAHTRTRAAR